MMQSYKQALVDTKSPTAQHDVQQAYGKVLEDMPPSPAAKSSFDGHLSDLNDTETLDGSTDSVFNRMSQRFETGQADAPAPNDRSPSSNPVHFESRLQNQLATIVPADSPLWAFPETLHPIMKSAEKLFTDPAGMTAQDHARLDVLRASGATHAEAILVCVEKPEVAGSFMLIALNVAFWPAPVRVQARVVWSASRGTEMAWP